MTQPPPHAGPTGGVPAWLGNGLTVTAAVVGGGLVTATRDPGWSVLCLVAFGFAALGTVRRRVLLAAAACSALGWLAGLGWTVTRTADWSAAQYLSWSRSGVALLACAALAVLVHRVVTRGHREVQQALDFARDASVHDHLTGLANRKGLAMLGAQILETARRRGDAVYCMFLDVDGLASINERLGRATGDEVLLTVSEALTRSTRATDAVARWGDDEFVVVGPGTGLAPLEMERRVRARALENSPLSREQWSARISAGGAVLEPWDDGNLDTLLQQADREMHLRRALRREAATPPYRPVRVDPSPRPPDPRRPAGWPD